MCLRVYWRDSLKKKGSIEKTYLTVEKNVKVGIKKELWG